MLSGEGSMSTFSRRASIRPTHTTASRCPHTPPSAGCGLSEYAVQAVALRLRLLGHPTRLRLVRTLHEHDGDVVDLAGRIGDEPAAVSAHLRTLHQAGIVCRTDARGPAVYRLVDWADWWLIDQFASRLSDGARRRDHSGGGAS